MILRALQAFALAVAALVGAGGMALAQATFSDTFKGFSRNSKDPIQIEANQLEVHDKDSVAIFTGDVSVRQKDAHLRTQRLKVFYERKSDDPAAAGGDQNIRRMEADGKVVISQCDQTATGDAGVFDIKADTATLTGNVVLTQGPNVARGEKLVVNTKTGQATLLNPTTGRVQLVVVPRNDVKDEPKKPGEPKKDEPAKKAAKPPGGCATPTN